MSAFIVNEFINLSMFSETQKIISYRIVQIFPNICDIIDLNLCITATTEMYYILPSRFEHNFINECTLQTSTDVREWLIKNFYAEFYRKLVSSRDLFSTHKRILTKSLP